MPPPKLLPKPKRQSRTQFIQIVGDPEVIVNPAHISLIWRFKTQVIIIIEGQRLTLDRETGDRIIEAIGF
ncbi:MAG: hypothetical protein AAGA60_29260 [Cyanobacteria bacterium P01_E01_bin.42]